MSGVKKRFASLAPDVTDAGEDVTNYYVTCPLWTWLIQVKIMAQSVRAKANNGNFCV